EQKTKIPLCGDGQGRLLAKNREQGGPHHYLAKRLYALRASRRRSWGRAMTVWLLMPVMVSAATMALTTASSVAWTVARKIGSSESLGSMVSWWSPLVPTAPGLAVEKAMKMSPEPSPE